MSKWLPFLVGLVVSSVFVARSAGAEPCLEIAADEPPPASTSKALFLSGGNALVDYLQHTRQAEFQLNWDWLPPSDALKQLARRSYSSGGSVTVRQYSLKNENLGAKKRWISNIKSVQDQQFLARAIGLKSGNLADFDLERTDNEFRQIWVDGGPGYNLVGPSITNLQYLSLLRDHYLITTLLASDGAIYSVEVLKGKPRGPNPRFSDTGIRWNITVYKVVVQKQPEVAYYRFSVAMTTDPIRLLFPQTDVSSTALDVGVDFKSGEGTVGLFVKSLSNRNLPVDLSHPPSTSDLSASAERYDSSKLSTVLSVVGGVSLESIIAKGLFGGSSEASIVTGGLIGAGKLSKVIGLNREIVRTAFGTGGMLLGIVPDSSNTVFVGPSLQASIFTFAIGDRIFEKGSGSGVTDRIAGMVSVDLSRALGLNKDRQILPLRSDPIGGTDQDISSDDLGRNLVLVSINLKSSAVVDAPAAAGTFLFTQIKDAQGVPISDESKRARLFIPVSDFVKGKRIFRFVSSGHYEVTGDPLKLYDIKAGADGITRVLDYRDVPLTAATKIEVSYELVRKSN